MSILIKGMKMPKTCMDCPFKGFDRAGGRGNICTINESITLHAVLDGVDVKFVRMGDCPLVEIVQCKDCKHYEREKVYNIQGVPIFAHDVCSAWGTGCKTAEDGWCYLGERRNDESAD